MLLLMVAWKWSLVGRLAGYTLLNRSRNRSAFSFGLFIVVLLFEIRGPSGERLDPFPSMLLVKVQRRGWSCGPRFEMKEDQASFFALMMCLFFRASAFFHSVLRCSDVGDLHQFLSAIRAFFTSVLHSAFHQGRDGSEFLARDGFDFLKHFSFAPFNPVMNAVVAASGFWISENLSSMSAVSMRWFQSPHLFSLMIHLGGCLEIRAGVVLSVRIMGRWSLPRLGPIEIVAEEASSDDVIVRSIVDIFPLAGSILVPRSVGVMRHMSWLLRMVSKMVFPAVLAVALLSHTSW